MEEKKISKEDLKKVEDEVCTKKGMAEYFHCSEKTIDRLRKEGLPCYDLSGSKSGGKVLFFKSEAIKWVKENKRA